MNLATIDTATLQPSPELDALIAEKWMGWKLGGETRWAGPLDNKFRYKLWLKGREYTGYDTTAEDGFFPSTNPAHAGEARRKVDLNGLKHHGLSTVEAFVAANSDLDGHCDYSETNGDKGGAEALATCRAIVNALNAAKAEGEDVTP